MLFFFEMFLFVLVMLTLALGEFVSRWLALILWLIATVFALVGYVLARRSLQTIIAAGDAAGPPPSEAEPAAMHGHATAAEPAAQPVAEPAVAPVAATQATDPQVAGPAAGPTGSPPDANRPDERVAPEGAVEAPREVTPLDARWARTLLYNWRRTNVLLVVGAFVVGGWYWLS